MLSEDLISGDRGCLGAVADAELGVEVTQLSLHGVLADVEVTAKFTIGHSRRKQGQELAFSFGKAPLAARPAQRFIDLCVLRPLGQHDPLAPRCCSDAIDDLIPMYGFGDETLCACAQSSSHRLRAVGKAEDHDGSVLGVSAERAHSFIEGFRFSVGVEKRDVDASSRPLPDVEFDDPDLGVAGLEEGSEPLKDDHVIVDECDPNRFGHAQTIRSYPGIRKSPDRVIDPYAPVNDPDRGGMLHLLMEAGHSAPGVASFSETSGSSSSWGRFGIGTMQHADVRTN
jgi:hypothetical protein